MKSFLQKAIKKIGHNMGLEVKNFPTAAFKSRLAFMQAGKFDLILDVGANIGQFGKEVRGLGYKNDITSFEPLRSAYRDLKESAELDGKWAAYNFALGNENTAANIHISKHSASSSLLEFESSYLSENESLTVLELEKIEVKKLDDIFGDLKGNKKNILLKLDTQGYEKQVLEGASNVLEQIRGIQIETSIKELYHGETLFVEMLTYLNNKGFNIFTLEPYYYDQNTAQLLQVECYLLKTK